MNVNNYKLHKVFRIVWIDGQSREIMETGIPDENTAINHVIYKLDRFKATSPSDWIVEPYYILEK